MSLEFESLHQGFAARCGPVELPGLADETTLAAIRAGMDEHAVLVFNGQFFDDEQQLEFARRLDGTLHAKTGSRAIAKSRFGNEALTDISNLDKDGNVMAPDDRRRLYSLANRLWHTDASFEDPAGRYSTLSARVVPQVPADTEFADMRGAYDALPDDMKARIEPLRVHHSIAYSRQTLGFEFSAEELALLEGAVHPMVRTLPRSGRKSLYLASHASRVIDWTLPEGRLLIRELLEHATQPQFVFRHRWREGDLVMWDNRATMHRGRPFADASHKRELRRVTTLDITAPRESVMGTASRT